MNQKLVKHGNMMVVDDIGVLIIGDPNIGKSEISLALLDRGHQFISDDATELVCEDNSIIASCPEITRQFMQIDYVGVVNLAKLFGENCCLLKHRIDLCIALKAVDILQETTQPLRPQVDYFAILGVDIPCYALPVTAGKQIPLLIEVIAHQFKMERSGYCALSDLQAKQRSQLNKED